MRLAYADPPYLGCCGLYGHRHEEPWGCWDRELTHRALLANLMRYDGWALSLTSTSLAWMLGECTQVSEVMPRVAAWVKPFAAYKANVRIAYTWEPVLFVPGRDSSANGAPVGRDHPANRDPDDGPTGWPQAMSRLSSLVFPMPALSLLEDGK